METAVSNSPLFSYSLIQAILIFSNLFISPVILHNLYSFLWIPSLVTQPNLMRAECYLPIREDALAIAAKLSILFFKSFLIGCNISNMKFGSSKFSVLQANNKTEFSLKCLWVCLNWQIEGLRPSRPHLPYETLVSSGPHVLMCIITIILCVLLILKCLK